MPRVPRSLVSNSVGSVIASGMLIFSTVLIPAILARSLTRGEFDAYSFVLAALPLMVMVPQSLRTVAATQLALAIARYGETAAQRGYRRFITRATLLQFLVAVIAIEAYVAANHGTTAPVTVREGLYGLLAYALGLVAVGLVVAPAAAHRDFRPDNVAKLWPGLFQLIGIALIWAAGARDPLPWIFVVYAASSWSVVPILAALDRQPRRTAAEAEHASAMAGELFHGLRGVLWWNLTAYLATTSTVMIVAIGFPRSVVPFSVASSLVGIVSAALIAVSGPVAAHATAMLDRAPAERRRFFLVVNTLFQGYIAVAALVILLAPVSLYALWLTPALAANVKWFSILLLPAAATRLLTAAFTLFVMSAGRQHTLWLSPLIEAVMTVAGSLLLGTWLGIDGIALALFASAAVRLALTVALDERRNRAALSLDRGDVLLSAWRLARARAC